MNQLQLKLDEQIARLEEVQREHTRKMIKITEERE